jgi:L-lactate dehydrogenase complex protein LldG
MKISPSKETILKKIRKALIHSTPLPFPKSEGANAVFHKPYQELELEFAEQFTKLQGKFIFCVNQQEFAFQLRSLVLKQGWKKIYCREENLIHLIPQLSEFATDDLAACDVSLTGCEHLVARTGTIMMTTAQASGRTVSVYAPVHICVAYTSQLVFDLKDALQQVKSKFKNQMPSLITFASGPSRTADIEKTLVVGVHGPKEVYCFLLDE